MYIAYGFTENAQQKYISVTLSNYDNFHQAFQKIYQVKNAQKCLKTYCSHPVSQNMYSLQDSIEIILESSLFSFYPIWKYVSIWSFGRIKLDMKPIGMNFRAIRLWVQDNQSRIQDWAFCENNLIVFSR